MTSYQSAWSQSSHEDCWSSVGRLTACPPDPSATLRETELAGAVAQCLIHDTASQEKAFGTLSSKSCSRVKRKESMSPSKGLIATMAPNVGRIMVTNLTTAVLFMATINH